MKAKCDMAKKIRVPCAKTQKRQENQSFGLRICRLHAEPFDILRVLYAKYLLGTCPNSLIKRVFPLDALFYIPGVFAEDVH